MVNGRRILFLTVGNLNEISLIDNVKRCERDVSSGGARQRVNLQYRRQSALGCVVTVKDFLKITSDILLGTPTMSKPPKVLSPDDLMRHAITAELRANALLIHQFASAWYQSLYTFRTTRVLGYPACKIPFDLWVIHDLFCQYRFETVVECGTAGGGTTLWYAILMDLLKIPNGRVYSIDLNPPGDRPQHRRISYILGSTIDPEIAGRIDIAGPVLINLDSDHRALHVLDELELWAPRVPVGGWLVVEDTNSAPVERNEETGEITEGAGPFAAIMEYMLRHPGELVRDVVCERYWLSMMNPHGWMQRLKECQHG